MFAKIQITGTISIETGLHIGGSSAFAAIGAVDSPVIKDVRDGTPIIPGSSLKGKMRTLLAKEKNERICSPNDDCIEIARLFGTSASGHAVKSRLLFSDMRLVNEAELRALGIQSLKKPIVSPE